MINKSFAIDVVGLNTIKHQRHQLAFAIYCKFIHIIVFYSLLYLIAQKKKNIHLSSVTHRLYSILKGCSCGISSLGLHHVLDDTIFVIGLVVFTIAHLSKQGGKTYVSKDWWNVFNIGNSWPWAVYLSLERSVIKKKKVRWREQAVSITVKYCQCEKLSTRTLSQFKNNWFTPMGGGCTVA